MDELLSEERLLEPLNALPLNVAPLFPLPNERIERSEFGIWIDCPLRELKLRDESLPDDDRELPDELLDEKLRVEDEPLLPLLPLLFDERPPSLERSFLLSLSRAKATLAVRKTDRRPVVATHLRM